MLWLRLPYTYVYLYVKRRALAIVPCCKLSYRLIVLFPLQLMRLSLTRCVAMTASRTTARRVSKDCTARVRRHDTSGAGSVSTPPFASSARLRWPARGAAIARTCIASPAPRRRMRRGKRKHTSWWTYRRSSRARALASTATSATTGRGRRCAGFAKSRSAIAACRMRTRRARTAGSRGGGQCAWSASSRRCGSVCSAETRSATSGGPVIQVRVYCVGVLDCVCVEARGGSGEAYGCRCGMVRVCTTFFVVAFMVHIVHLDSYIPRLTPSHERPSFPSFRTCCYFRVCAGAQAASRRRTKRAGGRSTCVCRLLVCKVPVGRGGRAGKGGKGVGRLEGRVRHLRRRGRKHG